MLTIAEIDRKWYCPECNNGEPTLNMIEELVKARRIVVAIVQDNSSIVIQKTCWVCQDEYSFDAMKMQVTVIKADTDAS